MLSLASSGRSDVCVCVWWRKNWLFMFDCLCVCCLFMFDCNLVLCWVFSWSICVVNFDWMYVKFQMPHFVWDVIYDWVWFVSWHDVVCDRWLVLLSNIVDWCFCVQDMFFHMPSKLVQAGRGRSFQVCLPSSRMSCIWSILPNLRTRSIFWACSSKRHPSRSRSESDSQSLQATDLIKLPMSHRRKVSLVNGADGLSLQG